MEEKIRKTTLIEIGHLPLKNKVVQRDLKQLLQDRSLHYENSLLQWCRSPLCWARSAGRVVHTLSVTQPCVADGLPLPLRAEPSRPDGGRLAADRRHRLAAG